MRSASFKSYLKEAENPLTNSDQEQLLSEDVGATDRTILEAELGYYWKEATKAVHQAVYYLYGEPSPDYDLIREWLERKQSFRAQLKIAHTYYLEGNYSDLINHLDAIPQILELSSSQLQEHSAFATYMNILITAIDEGRSEARLAKEEINAIYNIAIMNGGFTSSFARNLLKVFYGYDFETPSSENMIINENSYSEENIINQEENQNSIVVFPNPVKNDLSFKFEGSFVQQDRNIEIRNLTGNLVSRLKIDSGTSKMVFDASVLPPGTYFYIIIAEDKIISTDLFVVLD